MTVTEIHQQLRALEKHHPRIFACVDRERVTAQQALTPATGTLTDDFGSSSEGGRGERYVTAQQSTRTRARGIAHLMDLVTEHGRADSPILVDLLGGDGLVHRVVTLLGRDTPLIVTCDASPFMVRQAWDQGIPALLQRAEASVLRTNSVGAVMLAYGSHHVPPALRPAVVREAFRVLLPGGLFLLHDFLTGSPVDTWFSKVVDVYAATGHDYAHFDRDETVDQLRDAGLTDVEARPMDDSFLVHGATRDDAENALGRYLVDMYGLVGLVEERGEAGAHRRAFELATDIFRYERPGGGAEHVRADRDADAGTWSVTMPRRALVVHGRKPAPRP